MISCNFRATFESFHFHDRRRYSGAYDPKGLSTESIYIHMNPLPSGAHSVSGITFQTQVTLRFFKESTPVTFFSSCTSMVDTVAPWESTTVLLAPGFG